MIGILAAAVLAATNCEADPAAAGCALWANADAPATIDRAGLEEIYARPEFSRARLRNQGTLEQLYRRLVLWLETLLGSRGAEGYAEVSRFLVLLLAALTAGWAVLRVFSRRVARPLSSPVAAPGAASLALEDPAAHLSRARAQLTTDPRGAIREGLLSLLSVLERGRLARPDRVKTNRELARELPGRGAPPELTTRVEALLGWYDLRFYSLEPVPSDDAARFLDDVERIRP